MTATLTRSPTYEALAEGILGASARVPKAVLIHAARSLYNVLGTAAGAAITPGVDRLVKHADAGATGVAACPGRRETADPYHAALTTGFAAHLADFDDTHLATVIHPAAACLGAAWAGAQELPKVSAHRVLRAFALGCEVQLRLGLAVTPSHYDEGWHITGTCGVIGAAVTAAVTTGANARVLARTLRAASLLTLGHRESFGTELKPFHAGKAAANGIVACRHAWREDTETVLRDERDALPSLDHLLTALAKDWNPATLSDFGDRWELLDNAFKPYPCGIVAHPGIDAALDLVSSRTIRPQDVTRIDYECHPLVPELMGKTNPGSGLAARFSAVHGVAVAIARGAAGIEQFSDEAAAADDVSTLRCTVRLLPDQCLDRDEAVVTAHLSDGSLRRSHVSHARGSLARPLTDEELREKVRRLLPAWLPPADELWQGVHAAAATASTTGAELFAPWHNSAVPHE